MLDYNHRLKPLHNKGKCGDEEFLDDDSDLNSKIAKLAKMIRAAKHCIVFTGAGISTSAGIPDFRGPDGVWTREIRGDTLRPEEKTSAIFDQAQPTFTHFALVEMVKKGLVQHVISQNVDGLHLRSDLDPEKLSELHGNICMEVCERCQQKYFHDHDIGGMGMNYTGNMCTVADCGGRLRDFAVDWDTELPREVFNVAYRHMRSADLVICLGSSLRIRPAGNMPGSALKSTKARGGRGEVVIVNLQKTHLDKKAALRIFHYCDTVMKKLCEKLYCTFEMSKMPVITNMSFNDGIILAREGEVLSWAQQQQGQQGASSSELPHMGSGLLDDDSSSSEADFPPPVATKPGRGRPRINNRPAVKSMRKRGRPRKILGSSLKQEITEKRPRGRPRKVIEPPSDD